MYFSFISQFLKTGNSKFDIFGQERTFGRTICKNYNKSFQEFSFMKNPAKCENASLALQPPLNIAQNFRIFTSLVKKLGSRFQDYLSQFIRHPGQLRYKKMHFRRYCV